MRGGRWEPIAPGTRGGPGGAAGGAVREGSGERASGGFQRAAGRRHSRDLLLSLSLSLSDFILHFQILFNLLCFHPLFTEAPSLCLYIFTSSGYF